MTISYQQIYGSVDKFKRDVWRLIEQGADFATNAKDLVITVYSVSYKEK